MIIRWGICSAGRICSDFTQALRSRQEEHLPIAVAAKNLDRAEQFAKSFNIPKAYGSYEELANDSEVEIVYIGTVNSAHLSLCKLFLNAGKHVLCEKPLTLNVNQCKEVIALAKEKNRFLMEGFWSRFFPISVQIRKMLHEKLLGEIKILESDFYTKSTEVERISSKELGGGSLLDLGCYCIQMAVMVFGGRPEKVTAFGSLLPTGVDESCTLILSYKGGNRAVLNCHTNTVARSKAQIIGTAGYLEIDHPMWSPTTMTSNKEKYHFGLPKSISIDLEFTNSEGFVYEVDAVGECLKKGLIECPIMPHEDSLIIAEIIEEAHRQLGITFP